MATTRPLHPGESVDTRDPYAGISWTVQPAEHVGHRMTVLGRIDTSSMYLVACECGHEFRMSYPTIANGRDGIRASA